ncbi:hypothetical protein PVAND_015719 [Polypedilum vanderplanki]|uniref:CUB domain-containing protein n=1 Tax=Polypedilum vanderplanki TaxID=319348 RepID=A0A9J6BDD0_POLVA|nr:hypothetical protein PVAND_015719 [Polypedilum vanderplanki]
MTSSIFSYSKLWLKILLLGLIFTLVQTSTQLDEHEKQSIEKRAAGLPIAPTSDSNDDHCNKTVDIYVDIQSPPLTRYNRNRPLTCWYRFKSIRGIPKEWVLRLTFKKFKVGTLVNSTHCDGGYLQIVDGNSKTDVSNRREPGMFCGEAEQPQTFISETSYVKVVFHTDNFTDQTYFAFDSKAETEVYLRYGQHPELYPNRRGEIVQGSYCEREFRDCRLQTCYVQSPAYPGIYPRALKCRYRLHTRQPFIKLYLQNEQFAVDGQRCENLITCPMKEIGSGPEHCPYDWLAVHDGRDENSPIIGQFCGMGKFPFSIIGTSQHMYVEFVSSQAGPLLNTGFHFNVGNWPGHVEPAGVKKGACDWILSSNALKQTSASEGIFLSVSHWYPPNTICNYHIQGVKNEIVRLYFPSFRINRIEAPIVRVEGRDCAESLTIYDSDRADPSRVIKTFCDTFSKPMEKVDFVSTGRSMFVRFVSKTGSYSGSSLYYWGHYDFFNNTKFGAALENTLCDEIFYAWEHPKGILRSPLNTLIYKQIAPNSDIRCQYKFVNDKRAFSRVVIEMISIAFKETPINVSPCTRCHEEHVDKIIIWEEKNKTQHRLACFCDNIPRPVRIISSDKEMNLEMMVLGQYATQHYFKYSKTLFTANYEFLHPPICGGINLGPKSDGELVFPHTNAFGLPLDGTSQKTVKCIWELKVSSQRDLFISIDKAKFGIYGSCEVGKIEIYIAGRLEPRFVICPENATQAKELPILSAAELGAIDNFNNEALPVFIQYTGDNRFPGKSAFRLVWTELFHLPRNTDKL